AVHAGRANATAVDVALGPVLHRVVARRRGAHHRLADAADAVLVDSARLSGAAAAAGRAAAIDVRLGPVLDAIGAGRGNADPREAEPFLAIRVEDAEAARCAWRTVAPAV